MLNRGREGEGGLTTVLLAPEANFLQPANRFPTSLLEVLANNFGLKKFFLSRAFCGICVSGGKTDYKNPCIYFKLFKFLYQDCFLKHYQIMGSFLHFHSNQSS